MKKSEVVIAILGLIVVGLIAYYSGYGRGLMDSFQLIADNMEDVLDIELSDRAKMVLAGHPSILRQVLTRESMKNLLSSLNISAAAKGGIGPGWFLNE